MIRIKDATLSDFANFELHEKNVEELKVAVNLDIDLCMAILWDASKDKTLVLVDDVPTCLLGVIDEKDIWLFFSKNINKLPLSFFKESRKFISKYENLEGRIYSENTFALQWAKFMGFVIEKAEPYGIDGKLFHKFHKGKEI